MSIPYRTDHLFPFPMLPVVLHGTDARVGPLEALVDTGADATLIPLTLLKLANAERAGWVVLRTHFGHPQRLPRFLLSIQVADFQLHSIYAVGDHVGQETILGRDILNKLPLFLDGPQLQSEVLDDATVRRVRARRQQS